MKKYIIAMIFMLTNAPAYANVSYLNFENIEIYPQDIGTIVSEYYNGGAASNGNIGPNFGVSFGTSAVLLCLNTPGVSCTNVSRGGLGLPGSQHYAVGFLFDDIINVRRGFDTAISFVYSNPFSDSAVLLFYDAPDATGNLLGRLALPQTPLGQCDPQISGGAQFCPFFGISFAFEGVARSIRANAENVVFDDLTFGAARIGGVPEPQAWAMMITGFGMIGAASRRRRQAGARAITPDTPSPHRPVRPSAARARDRTSPTPRCRW